MKALAIAFAVISTLCLADVKAFCAEPLKFGVAAMISPQETVKYYDQIIDYVGKKLGRPVEMVQKRTYEETDRLLESGELKLAFVCSGPYVTDKEKFGVELLVAPQSYGEPFYYAYIITHRSSKIRNLAGLKGKSFAFTDPKSNTGKLAPTYMIGKSFNLPPEKFFSKIIYTRTHDKAIEAVAKKIVAGASVDSLIYNYAASKNPRFTSQTKIIAKSPRYGIPPIVVRGDLDPVLKARIRNIFLTMHEDPEGREILAGIKVDRFIVPKDADYDSVREMEKWLKKNIK
ncbi:phosphate/phosphite/phosphonate ABC transporter substrate-binding protein [Geomonas terrae]|uniref:Phosphate/phosphite/phosphonate ABC transporter substrate-binding protein n=1 Tax=Geomonas terrae TaxID=2562681 RepID=A0A4S1CBQ9_9BACT|nr:MULTISPECIES: phosphate/phosphite/phosphonate ABC transporter substrate-binding protein [Geomonas]TGU70787.1 phosphate/phosphite/phosphonate ABC transporter substrate-binding protein [Geomonas terrae]